MRIRLLTMIRGAHVSGNPGEEVDAPDELARALVANGAAVEIADDEGQESETEAPPEAAVAEAPENAAQPRPTRRSRRAEE